MDREKDGDGGAAQTRGCAHRDGSRPCQDPVARKRYELVRQGEHAFDILPLCSGCEWWHSLELKPQAIRSGSKPAESEGSTD